MDALVLTSCMSTVADPLCIDLARYLAARMDKTVEFANELPYPERVCRLRSGVVDVGWICGLLYVWMRQDTPDLEPIVAPIMLGGHHRQQPIYFSDVIVHCDSPVGSLDELGGATWAYNEQASFSGFHNLRHALTQMERDVHFLGTGTQAGSHLRAIEMVCSKGVDFAAIDSTALQMVLAQQPMLCTQIRTIASIGPDPMPPFVVAPACDLATRECLATILLAMHEGVAGRKLLNRWQVARFAPVNDDYYDRIREKMAIIG